MNPITKRRVIEKGSTTKKGNSRRSSFYLETRLSLTHHTDIVFQSIVRHLLYFDVLDLII